VILWRNRSKQSIFGDYNWGLKIEISDILKVKTIIMCILNVTW
jgi:hypothetical protein